MPKVLFVQRMIPDYRLPLFVCLHKKLQEANIDFYVTTGASLSEDCLNDVVGDYQWIIKHKNRYIYKHIHVHNIKRIEDYDLVIVMQENSHIINYSLLLRRYIVGRPLIGFYGHGKNLNTQGKKIREFIKKKISLLPDWWFAYTALTERIVVNNGFPENRITVANNAIDDVALKKQCSEQSIEKRILLKEEIGICKNSKVALYCGRLIDIKVSFLVEALEKVRSKNDQFEVIIIGTGPLEGKIRSYSSQYEWMHYIGPVYGDERARYFCISDLFLMPGLVGLAILDAFASGLPMITTDCRVHSPEIEYLEQGVNGYMTSNNVGSYVEKINELFRDDNMLNAMKRGAKQSSEKYSIEKMADNFVVGIQQALKVDR